MKNNLYNWWFWYKSKRQHHCDKSKIDQNITVYAYKSYFPKKLTTLLVDQHQLENQINRDCLGQPKKCLLIRVHVPRVQGKRGMQWTGSRTLEEMKETAAWRLKDVWAAEEEGRCLARPARVPVAESIAAALQQQDKKQRPWTTDWQRQRPGELAKYSTTASVYLYELQKALNKTNPSTVVDPVYIDQRLRNDSDEDPGQLDLVIYIFFQLDPANSLLELLLISTVSALVAGC